MNQERRNAFQYGTLLAIPLVVVLIIAFGHPANTPSARHIPPKLPPLAPAAVIPASSWRVSISHSELDGQASVTATNTAYGEVSIVIRRTPKNLVCYVTTGEFLETTENMHSRRVPIKYRFDDDAIVRQQWALSDDNTALFVPGNPRAFIANMGRAKKFVIEYSPAGSAAQTASFDVSALPEKILAPLK